MKKKIESLKGKKSPCWVKVKFNDISEYVYGIAYYEVSSKTWFILQNKKDGTSPITPIIRSFSYSWRVNSGSILDIKSQIITELYILPRKPRTKEFKNISLKIETATIIKINGYYDATIFKGYIKVGCQEISNEVVRDICRELID